MSQITIGGTTLNFKDSAFTGDQWEQVASWVLNGGAEGIDANAQIATEKAAAASASAAAARNSATSAGESASSAAESIKHAPRINSSGKWELWDATKNAYVATEYTAIGEDGTKWWTYNGALVSLGEKIWVSYYDIPNASIGDFVLHTWNDAGVVYEITGRDALNYGNWLVEKKCVLKGTNGTTPTIGENGNWYIGDTDTGVKAASIYYVDISGTNDDITGSKTFAEIKAAYEANNVVVARQNIAIYALTYISDTRAEFTRVDATGYTVWSCSNSGAPSEADVWQFSNTKRVNYDTKYRDIGLKTVPVAIKELQDRSAPAVTDTDAGKYLHVNPSTKELEWAEIGNTSNYVLTEADKSEIAAMVMAKMSDGNTGS